MIWEKVIGLIAHYKSCLRQTLFTPGLMIMRHKEAEWWLSAPQSRYQWRPVFTFINRELSVDVLRKSTQFSICHKLINKSVYSEWIPSLLTQPVSVSEWYWQFSHREQKLATDCCEVCIKYTLPWPWQNPHNILNNFLPSHLSGWQKVVDVNKYIKKKICFSRSVKQFPGESVFQEILLW